MEKKAGEKQVALLSTALSEASNAGGHWLNASGKGYPRFYPKGVSVSAFNALFMALHSDKTGARQTCSRSSAKPRRRVRRYASMSRACLSCSITGTGMYTVTTRNGSSAGTTT